MDKVVSVSVRPEGRICNYDAGLFAVYGKGFVIFDGPIGLDIDHHVAF